MVKLILRPPKKEPSRHGYSTRSGGQSPPKRKASAESWDTLEERGKRRRRDEDDNWRRRDSVTQLVASIYADIDAAIDIQRRVTGNGDPLTEEELTNFEKGEDLRLDYLRELRLTEMFDDSSNKNLRRARVPQGKRFDSVRAARDIVKRSKAARRQHLNSLIDSLGWTTMAACLHSENFRNRLLEDTSVKDFLARRDLLTSHRRSVDFFARSRLFDCLEESADQRAQDVLLRNIHCLFTGNVIPDKQDLTQDEMDEHRLNVVTQISGFPADASELDHPHEWKLSADGQRATRLDFVDTSRKQKPQRRLQENVHESKIILGRQKWGNRGNWLVKNEPRYRSELDEPCQACDDQGKQDRKKWTSDCSCTLKELKIRLAADGAYHGARVELRQMNPVMGTGVRALQRFPAGSLLEEYVGEIYPLSNTGRYNDNTYLLSQKRLLRRKHSEDAMLIDPSIYGNWTRYINHSCEPSADFVVLSCGDKMLTCVVVRDRPIEFGDEITINYGREYFVNQRLACRCGRDRCKLWNADNVDDWKKTLKQAKQQGIAPDWVKGSNA